jgi:hypothetical protein
MNLKIKIRTNVLDETSFEHYRINRFIGKIFSILGEESNADPLKGTNPNSIFPIFRLKLGNDQSFYLLLIFFCFNPYDY